jgi:hypothetical protein
MTDLKETVASRLAARYTKLAAVLGDLAAPLDGEEFWAKPFAFGNSFGHLVLHLTGNLNYYIGAQIAGTGYVRDSPVEFTNPTQPSKDEVLKKFNQAIEMVIDAINMQSEEDWSREYAAAGADATDRFGIVLSCATHLHHHVGQMMYLGFELRRKS